jgi:hypothetical protein
MAPELGRIVAMGNDRGHCGDDPLVPCCSQRTTGTGREMKEIPMLWALVVILVVLWLAGFLVVQVGGALIHLLLVIAAIVLIYQVVTGRRAL